MLYVHLLIYQPNIRSICVEQQSIMKTAINEKRQKYRLDIIKKERQQLFNVIRRDLRSNTYVNIPSSNVIQKLKNKQQARQMLDYLKKKIDEIDFFANFMNYQQDGLIYILINYLKEDFEIFQTFELIVGILAKNQLDFYASFYDHGLLQLAFNYLHRQCAAQCAYIIARFIIASNDYKQAVLYNNYHRQMIEQFKNRVNKSRNPQQQNEKEGDKFFAHILIGLDRLFNRHQSSTLQFTSQYNQILQFAIQVLEKKLFLRDVLGIIYQCVYEIRGCTTYLVPHINKLLAQISPEHKCFYNMFAVIYAIINYEPTRLDFDTLFKSAAMAQKVQTPTVKIMQKMIYYGKQFIDFIPKGQQWWQKMLMSPDKSKNHCSMLRILYSIGVQKQWVWKYLSAALETDIKQVKLEAIDLISCILKRSHNLSRELQNIQLYRVHFLLEGISETGSMALKQKASKILDFYLILIKKEQMRNQSV